MIIFKKNIPRKYFFIFGAVLFLIVVFFVLNRGESLKIIKVNKANVVQEVVSTGTSKARNEVDLGFDMNGRVARAYAKVGDRVGKGTVLAELDIATELANLLKERALLAEEKATIINNSEKLASLIREAYRAADNAIRNKTDQFFKTPRDNPRFEVKFSDANFEHYFNVPSEVSIDLNNTRKKMEELLIDWKADLVKINENNTKQYSVSTIARLDQVSDFLNKIAYAVNSFTPAEFIYESTVQGYKTAVNTARSEVSIAEEALINASSYTVGNAKIDQIQASIESLMASLSKSRIIAPFAGTVTQQEAKIGETVKAGENLISLISEGEMYIEAKLSEINIGKVAVGNIVWITFDAYPKEMTQGIVSYIEPGETIVDGVVNYKIRIDFQGTQDTRIKSGLTANLKIETARKEGVLTVPLYAVIREGGESFVKKLVDGKTIRTPISFGLSGNNGLVEILSGLEEGDELSY